MRSQRSRSKRSRSKSKNNKHKQEHHHQTDHRGDVDAIKKLMGVFNQVDKNKQWMIPLNQSFSARVDGRIVGNTYVINGPAQAGKASLVYWALRNDGGETAIVVVDCSIYRTEMQFIQKLAKEIGEQLQIKGLDKRTIVQESFKLSQFNEYIKEHDRPVVILIRNAERLVSFRKQLILYNLFQWVASEVKQWVGLVFTTRLVSFIDRFEKRVKSRLCANTITIIRPPTDVIVKLLVRRVEWLCEQERQYVRGSKARQQFYEKIQRALQSNKKLQDIIKRNQEYSQKDVVFYLNAIRMVFSGYESEKQILEMDEKSLKADMALKLEQSFEYIFPFIPKHLLQTCTFPEYLVMAIIVYMGSHNRTPFRFKTVYEVYHEFKQTWVTSEGMGSAFIYSKNILERSVLKLEELNLIELDNKEESIWNCDIRCAINPEEIKSTFDDMRDLPRFFKEILKS